MNKSVNAIIALATVLFLSGCGYNSRPGQSEKIGTLVRVGKVGIVSETWEAQLVRGGFQDGTGAMGQSFDFTIEDAGLAKVCRDYMDAGQEVKITYRSEWFYSSFRSESGGDFLLKVEPIAKK